MCQYKCSTQNRERESERESERERERERIKMNLYFYFHLIGIVGWWLWRSRDNISIARNEFEPFFTWGKNINEYFLFLLWMINKKGMFKMNICLGRSVRYVNFLYFEMIFYRDYKSKIIAFRGEAKIRIQFLCLSDFRPL